MSAGVEHYKEAERLLAGTRSNAEPSSPLEAMIDNNTLLAAQVHATLAMAAALTDSAVLL